MTNITVYHKCWLKFNKIWLLMMTCVIMHTYTVSFYVLTF